MTLQDWNNRSQPGRKIEGIAACLLPFEEDGSIAWNAYAEALERTRKAGLRSAVNMDTGYANYLTAKERQSILKFTRETLGPKESFVAGVFVEGLEGDLVGLYREQAEAIAELGGTPIFFQTTRLHNLKAAEIVDIYAKASVGLPEVIAFELGQQFAPNGMIFNEATVEGIMQIPEITGMKHSSLSRLKEMDRLTLRDRVRPDFRLYTGNDLGIDMVNYGSDYLLGLAAFCPEKFAERDRLWQDNDPACIELNDALQYLGNVAFRAPVPAYKHSCAAFQWLIGRIPTPNPHPKCPQRPDWDAEILRDCAARLGFNCVH